MGCSRGRHLPNAFDCLGGPAAVGGRAPYAARVGTSRAAGYGELGGDNIRDRRKSVAVPVKARGAIECPQLRSANLDVPAALEVENRRLKDELQLLKTSLSWCLTKPLRAISRVGHNVVL